MGKRKVGKQRKDKFYKLAKETGYRSRASFKLIQLNRKFEFLQKSRILIDLCAAPGGWLQVAQQSMPVSSLIIGVDLVSIKPLPNVITLQEDITTEKCKQSLKKQLKTWKADVVLHDGAPNVGKNWIHDAFAQIQLTLSALKLATEMLMPRGWFITKVFRSKDYNNLIWVFQKLFRKVHVTKPQASRNESAEIFVVCQGYLAPDKIDPKFLDSSFLFKEVDDKTAVKPNLLQSLNKKPKAVGYEEGDASVFFRLKASDFVFGDNHLELLAKSSEIIFDDKDIYDHRLTTKEIKEYSKDIKVLGKGELRSLLTWRKNLHAAIKEQDTKPDNDKVEEKKSIDELEIENAVKEAEGIELSKYQELKRKKKKMLKERKITNDKVNLKMIIKDDEPVIHEDRELFSIGLMKNKKDLSNLEVYGDMDLNYEPEIENEDEDIPVKRHKSNFTSYDRYNDHEAWDAPVISKESEFSDDDNDEEEELEFESDSENSEIENDDEDKSEDENPLLVDLVEKKERVQDTVNRWFDKEDFNEVLENEDDDDLELELLAENEKQAPRKVPKKLKEKNATNKIDSFDGADDVNNSQIEECPKDKENETIEIEPEKKQKKKKKRVMLTPEELALGSLMIQSKKSKRDILDNAYNRFSSNDENLPDWFTKDEELHYRKHLPVTAEMVAEYKQQLKEINARPIKKVIEFKARKKRKALKRMEKARKKADAITDNLDMSEREKSEQINSIYKRAMGKKKQSVTYVVAKKGGGKRPRRPAGLKGRYKVVDPRMKKDDRKQKIALKSKKKGSKMKKKTRR